MIASRCIVDISLVDGGQSEMKGRSAGRIWFEPDSSAMCLDDGARNRQADAHAVSFGGDKRLEHMLRYFRLDARAGIGDAHAYQIVGGHYRDLKVACDRSPHRIHRIADEIK